MIRCCCQIPSQAPPHVPLYSVLLDCEVKGALAIIKATQRFVNETEQPQECTLSIPVDEDSAIAKLVITLDDGRVLTAKVKDLDAAKEDYADAIAAGHTAVLGEMKDEKNFDLSVGNLAPNTGLETTLHFVVPLTCNGNKWLFTVPEWLMPAWGKPPMPAHVFMALAKEERRNEFGFSLRIVQTAEIISVRSVGNRDIEVTLDRLKHQAEVTLASSITQGAIKIEFETNEDLEPKTQLELDEATGEYVGMLSFIPPLLSTGESTNDLEGTGDYVLLLDRSGSMRGRAIEMAKEATILFIKSLMEGNKFNIVSFGSSFEKMFRESQVVNSANVEEAVGRIRGFGADMGGTNIYRPLQDVYREASDPAYPRSLYLLTDGEVEDKASVVSIIETNSKQTRVHAFGIGNSVDRSLILEVSKAAKGSAEFISDPSEIKKTVMSVLKKAILPSLSDLQVTWPNQTYEQFPSNKLLPVCYFGELLVTFVNYGREPPAPGSVMLQCVNTGSKSAATWTLAIDTNSSLGDGLHKLWAKHAIRELSIDYKKSQNEAALSRVKEISKKYGVPSEYTAFLCVTENDEPVVGKLQSTTMSMQNTAQHLSFGSSSYSGMPPVTSALAGSPARIVTRGMGMHGGPYKSRESVMSPGPSGMPSYPDGMTLCGGPPSGMPPVQMTPFAYDVDVCAMLPRSFMARAAPPSKPGSAMSPPGMMPPMAIPCSMPPQPMLKFCAMPRPPQMACAPHRSLAMAPEPKAMPMPERSPFQSAASLLSASLMDLISGQETSGKWLAAKITVNCPVPADFQYPDAGDVWTTLCVVVVIEAKFAAQADEWELIIRKARKVLKSAGVNIEQYRDQIKVQLGV